MSNSFLRNPPPPLAKVSKFLFFHGGDGRRGHLLLIRMKELPPFLDPNPTMSYIGPLIAEWREGGRDEPDGGNGGDTFRCSTTFWERGGDKSDMKIASHLIEV